MPKPVSRMPIAKKREKPAPKPTPKSDSRPSVKAKVGNAIRKKANAYANDDTPNKTPGQKLVYRLGERGVLGRSKPGHSVLQSERLAGLAKQKAKPKLATKSRKFVPKDATGKPIKTRVSGDPANNRTLPNSRRGSEPSEPSPYRKNPGLVRQRQQFKPTNRPPEIDDTGKPVRRRRFLRISPRRMTNGRGEG